MLNQYYHAVSDIETYIVLDVVKKRSTQGIDGNIVRRNIFSAQCPIQAAQPVLVLENVAEQRIFVVSLALHPFIPFKQIILHHQKSVKAVTFTNT